MPPSSHPTHAEHATPQAAIEYARKAHKQVDGWLTAEAMAAIMALNQIQVEQGITGGMCEIGVHHGKLFILLCLLARPNEKCVCYDLFDKQEENIDQSGKGDKETLEKHLCHFKINSDATQAIASNSLELTPEDIHKHCGGPVRLFSVDGGHTASVVVNDLCLAQKALCEGGVVLLDDAYNALWPGVTEGFCAYCFTNNTHLIPFALLGNKLFLTNSAQHAKQYHDALSTLKTSACLRKQTSIQGFDVVTLKKPETAKERLKAFSQSSRFIQSIKHTNSWTQLKKIANAVLRKI